MSRAANKRLIPDKFYHDAQSERELNPWFKSPAFTAANRANRCTNTHQRKVRFPTFSAALTARGIAFASVILSAAASDESAILSRAPRAATASASSSESISCTIEGATLAMPDTSDWIAAALSAALRAADLMV